jgi:uncharacterized RDD family membrane protein YckC
MAAPYPSQAAGYGWSAPPPDPTAVVGKRIGALLLDFLLTGVIIGALIFAVGDQTDAQGALRDHSCRYETNEFGADTLQCDGLYVRNGTDVFVADWGPVFGVITGVGFVYFALLQGLTGATLGKLATGVRVVGKDGTVAGLGRCVVRWLFFIVDGPMTLYICGLVTMLVSKRHQRVGDLVAGTYVVAKAAVGQPIPPIGAPAPAGYAPQPPGYAQPPAYPPPPAYPQPAAPPPPPPTSWPPPPSAPPPPPAAPPPPPPTSWPPPPAGDVAPPA